MWAWAVPAPEALPYCIAALCRTPEVPATVVVHAVQDEYKSDASCGVVEVDFYHAASLLPMSDDQIVAKVLDTMLPGRHECWITAWGRGCRYNADIIY